MGNRTVVVNQPKRRTRKLCRKGQQHVWVMGAALIANVGGDLTSDGRAKTHLKGTCKRCRKSQAFHPRGQHQRFALQRIMLPGIAA